MCAHIHTHITHIHTHAHTVTYVHAYIHTHIQTLVILKDLLCVCICMGICAHQCKCPQRPEPSGLGLGTELRSSWKSIVSSQLLNLCNTFLRNYWQLWAWRRTSLIPALSRQSRWISVNWGQPTLHSETDCIVRLCLKTQTTKEINKLIDPLEGLPVISVLSLLECYATGHFVVGLSVK